MSWHLLVYSADGATLQRTITNGISDGAPSLGPCIEGRPEADVDPPGITTGLSFKGKQNIVGATPRTRVVYKEDSTFVAAGVILTCPQAGTSGQGPFDGEHLGRFSAAGLELIIAETPAVPRIFPDYDTTTVLSQDIAKVAYRLAFFSAPVGITVDVSNFPDVGEEIPGFYEPGQNLDFVLDKLSKLVDGDASWWVDPTSNLHFEGN